ncbi:Zinc finger transcription factor [Parasponia andersonii]|uniref:Zinc finger transcription factor n=1 Tax=Parasponia andersonii TaxID=3476 RepID=A0A2P5BQI4_PARAD|nr:Zinc finger transcription factor [Parasponia andersonii]
MEKHRICKICNKRYSNGKALGGHMRSHLAKLPLPHKPQTNSTSTPPPQPHLTTSQYSSSSSHVHNQMESDTESDYSQYNHANFMTTRRRSKRPRRTSVLLSESKPPLFKAATLSAENAAMYLIKLSKDKWEKEEGGEAESLERTRSSSSFKCKTCKKVFGSYQALGGHKANHRKVDQDDDDDHVEEEEEEEEIDEEEWAKESTKAVVDGQTRTFECPFCFKVFASGQALGGHKKVHYSNNLAIIATRKCRNKIIIDLNLPALEVE